MAFPVVTRATDFLVTAAIWNADVVANMNTLGPIARMRNSADQSVSGTTLTNATGFSFPIGASEVWSVLICAVFTIDGAGDLKVGWTVPAAATGHHWTSADTLSSNWDVIANSLAVAATGSGTYAVTQNATVVNSTNAGTVQWQFASLTGTAPTLKANAFGVAWKIV